MSKHTTHRGVVVDMDILRRENAKVPAIGNMRVNAQGDLLDNKGMVTKTADQIARERNRVKAVEVKTGLKGGAPKFTDFQQLESPNKPGPTPTATAPKQQPKVKETELPSGDIVVEKVEEKKNEDKN